MTASSTPKLGDTSLQELVGRNWVTVEQAAKLTGLTYRTIRKYIHKDPKNPDAPPKLRATKVGGNYRIYEDDLKRFLQGDLIE